MKNASIGVIGLGAYLPERVMNNEEWAEHVNTSDEWITTRTGIKRRRIAAPTETTADMAVAAAHSALDHSGLLPGQMEEIIMASDTPEVYVPDTACFVQHRLGAREISAFDLRSGGCAGFLQAVSVACSRAHSGVEPVLVIGAELLSRLISWKDRNTCVLFGDAAGAMVIGTGEIIAEILAVVTGTDGSRADVLTIETGGTRRPFTLKDAQLGRHQQVTMNGRELFREAVRRMSEAAYRVLASAGLSLQDVNLVIPHQANLRIIESVANALELPMNRFFINVHEYGNTGSASIPLALWEAYEKKHIAKGDIVLLTSFGAGLHWAAALLRF
jgi:3-oxoacyl-[acyl-carrier-protein] synthase III